MLALGLQDSHVFIFTINYDEEGHVEMLDVGRVKLPTEQITCVKIAPGSINAIFFCFRNLFEFLQYLSSLSNFSSFINCNRLWANISWRR